ncbi:disintegrin and metalloproteinase domain-containing protein 21-like [Elgaria multicarinata webbii]|uniref:disintegrin and metalloproteinase domain-containing protein 21-like n=1 Tax=Elgaria multicarinata webbii TaxID=159646 RepID=UPI002FCCE256
MENISTRLLMLILWNFMNETAGQIPPQGFRYASYEVTIPRKLTPRYGQQEPHHVNYLVHVEGKGHMVHLRQKKGFIPKHFPVFTYNTEGELQVDYPFMRDDCFYLGSVEGTPSSLVTLSTCSGGLRGLLRLENETYEIEPVQASLTFQHVVYRLEEKTGAVRLRCGLTEEEQSLQDTVIQKTENVVDRRASRRDWWSHTRYVKVAVVVEHERYVKFGRNKTYTAIQVLDVIHTANSFYEPLSLQISVVGLEIWSAKNLIEINDSMVVTLNSFCYWRKISLLPRLKNDAGHLFIYKTFGRTLGLAYVGAICNNGHGAAVESYVTSSLFLFSNTFAHELGHLLGMRHDVKYCHCEKKDCIMAESQENTDKFSNCSYMEYYPHRNTPCLLIPPNPKKMYKSKFCGNKVVEKGEQCDCGSKAECDLDLCCLSNCKLRPGADCNIGECCHHCLYRLHRTICRQKTSACDLPEFCNGTSAWCPEDLYVQDGAPCSANGYCYHGVCTTHSKQCKAIFGNQATVASENCFGVLNSQGDRFGNCGLKHGALKKCHKNNILCGRIQCENVNSLPSLEDHSTIIQTPVGNTKCWSIDYHSGMEIADIGAVIDGTPCGTDMMCIKRKCVSVSLLKYDCDVTKCHNRGKCNNRKHCHCNYGWEPPDCLNRGYGGSIDSGPAFDHRSVVIPQIIVGTVSVLFAATLALGLGVYYRSVLKHQFKRLSSRISPTKITEEGNPQRTTY